MKRRSFLALAASLPFVTLPTLAAAKHPYMGKPFISMVMSKRAFNSDSRVLATTKRMAVMVRDLPTKNSYGETMIEVVVPKRESIGPRPIGLPMGGTYVSDSIVDLEDRVVLKSRDGHRGVEVTEGYLS